MLCGYFYIFILMTVSSISSPAVMILEPHWKPRWVMSMSANSLALIVLNYDCQVVAEVVY